MTRDQSKEGCEVPSIDDVWARIERHQGELFRQKRGGEFTYRIAYGAVLPDRTNRQLPRSHFEKAFERLPVEGPGELQDLQGPSYLYAILTDSRIALRQRLNHRGLNSQ